MKAFDANDWIYQTWAYERHDVGTTPGFNGDTAKALASIKAKTLILTGTKDLLNPEFEPIEMRQEHPRRQDDDDQPGHRDRPRLRRRRDPGGCRVSQPRGGGVSGWRDRRREEAELAEGVSRMRRSTLFSGAPLIRDLEERGQRRNSALAPPLSPRIPFRRSHHEDRTRFRRRRRARAGITSPADAKGCLKGAAVGGVAGHYAGHHGVLGAAAGCLYGRHRANEQERQTQTQAIPATRKGRCELRGGRRVRLRCLFADLNVKQPFRCHSGARPLAKPESIARAKLSRRSLRSRPTINSCGYAFWGPPLCGAPE